MMNDCQDVAMREALPELMLGALPPGDRVRVQRHVDGCDDCRSELAIIRAVHGSSHAAVVEVTYADVSRIAAAIPPYRRQKSRIRKVYLELAAACLIGAVGISTFAVRNSGTSASPVASHAAPAAATGLALVNTADLSDAGLAQLTQDLDRLQALPTVDPESVTPEAIEAATEPGTAGGAL